MTADEREERDQLVNAFISRLPTLKNEYEEAELVYLLKMRFGLIKLSEIAALTGLTERQVRTRRQSYNEYAAQGHIPTGIVPVYTSPDGLTPKETVLADESERQKRLASGREFRASSLTELYLDKLAERVAQIVPSKHDLSFIEQAYKITAASRPKKKRDEAAVAVMSDLHLCLDVPGHLAGRSYDANNRFVNRVLRLTDLQRQNFNVKTLHLAAIGDLIQGTSNYSNQRWDVSVPAIDQAHAVTELLIKNIETFAANYDEVVVDWGNGNHEYIVPNKTTPDPSHSSWGQVIIRSLMFAFRGHKRIRFNVPESWYQIVPIMGSRFMFTHGHAMRGGGSFDGIVNQFRKWQDILPAFEYGVVGHFHRLAKLPLPKLPDSDRHRWVYMNGTAVASDTFLQQMGGSPVTQWWLLFLNDERITAEYSVDLYGTHGELHATV